MLSGQHDDVDGWLVCCQDNTMMLTGGLFVAIALERSELHRRIALFILKTVGTKPSW